MKKTLLLLSLLWIGTAKAQQSVNSSGQSASGSNGSVSYTVGQIDYVSASGSNGSVNQGVQQPFEFFTLGNDDFPSIKIKAIVYPNPTVSNINLSITNHAIENVRVQIYDLLGKEIMRQQVVGEQTVIKMENLSAGTYLLQVLENGKAIKTFKIIKK